MSEDEKGQNNTLLQFMAAHAERIKPGHMTTDIHSMDLVQLLGETGIDQLALPHQRAAPHTASQAGSKLIPKGWSTVPCNLRG